VEINAIDNGFSLTDDQWKKLKLTNNDTVILINAAFIRDPEMAFNLNNVCFDVDFWIEIADFLAGTGAVVILDERK